MIFIPVVQILRFFYLKPLLQDPVKNKNLGLLSQAL